MRALSAARARYWDAAGAERSGAPRPATSGLGLALEVALALDGGDRNHGVQLTGFDGLGQGVDDSGQGFQFFHRDGGHALGQLQGLGPRSAA